MQCQAMWKNVLFYQIIKLLLLIILLYCYLINANIEDFQIEHSESFIKTDFNHMCGEVRCRFHLVDFATTTKLGK